MKREFFIGDPIYGKESILRFLNGGSTNQQELEGTDPDNIYYVDQDNDISYCQKDSTLGLLIQENFKKINTNIFLNYCFIGCLSKGEHYMGELWKLITGVRGDELSREYAWCGRNSEFVYYIETNPAIEANATVKAVRVDSNIGKLILESFKRIDTEDSPIQTESHEF